MRDSGELRYDFNMRHDLLKLDQEVFLLRERRRAALSALAGPVVTEDDAPVPCPLDSRIFRVREDLEGHDDPLAQAIVQWLDVMNMERSLWEPRVRMERLWQTPHRVPNIDAEVSLRQLRAEALGSGQEKVWRVNAEGWISRCGEASSRTLAGLRWRLEREGDAYLAVDGASLAVDLATRVLAATDGLASEGGGGLVTRARRAIGREAGEGWPARLNQRWLGDVFAGTGLGDGVNVRIGAPPRRWGATSFARSLGLLGAAVLDASRSPSVPFSMHKRPRGHRRHARRALFASTVLERAFARRILDLGQDRLRDHRRLVAIAICESLRFDALRVLLTNAVAEGEGAARDLFSDLTDRHFGGAADTRFIGVLPRLRPADGPALVGAVLAFAHRAELLEAHDEDWFRNPRAIEQIRHEDERAAGPAPDKEQLDDALAALVALIEDAAG